MTCKDTRGLGQLPDNLEMKFLGPPEVSYGGKAVKFATRKALALFTYLVVEASSHSREKLMDLFWPESETHLAQSALRNTLARIKEGLRGITEPLRMEGDRVRVEISIASTLDLELVAWVTHESQLKSDVSINSAQLQNAVKAVRGAFMDGLSLPDAPAFEEWLMMQRALWEYRVNIIHDRLSNLQLETHLIQPAIETVNRWLVLDRLNETAYQRLMRLYLLNGDRHAALKTYETCRAVLEKELGVKPSPETEVMLDYIHSKQKPVSNFGEQAEQEKEAFPIPFVGRSNEYQGLVKSFRLVKKGKPQSVVVTGESGIGKTRLTDEFLNWACIEGADVLHGRAIETSEQLLPYQPIIDALRERLEHENAPEDLLDDVWLTELTRILPELRERYPDLPPITRSDSTTRSRLFEALARLVDALSVRHPLVWVVDDLQSADVETLALLRYLIRNWQKGHKRVMLLMLVHSKALSHGAKLRDWMGSLARDVALTRFSLAPILASDIHEIIITLAGGKPEGVSELSALFMAETSGQPFLVTEMLTALDNNGTLAWNQGKLNSQATLANLKYMDVESLVPSIRDIVLSRIEWLSQSALAVLSAAAVIGRNCNFDLLNQVSGIGELNCLNALDELKSARMILEFENEVHSYAVSHDRIRKVVYTQLSAARQQIFHLRTLSALAEQKTPFAELAHHALSAKEWQFAFQYSLDAGDEAMHLYAIVVAVQHYETARALLNEKKTDAETATYQHLYIRLGKAYELQFHHRQALDVYEEMQAQAFVRESREMELAALVARCALLPQQYDTQDLELAKSLVSQAVPMAQTLNDSEAHAELEMSLAMIHKFSDTQIEPVVLHLRVAEGLARQANLNEQLGLATLELGVAFLWIGQVEQAEQKLLESVDIFRKLTQSYRVLNGLHNLAIIYTETGRFDSALGCIQEASQVSELLGSPTSKFALAVTRNVIHILRGEYDRVLENLHQILEMHEDQIVPGLWIDIYQQLAWCFYDLGAYQDGVKYCQKAIWEHGHVNTTGYSAAFAMLAILKIKCGEASEAETIVRLGWENFNLHSQNYPGWWETHSIIEAEAELALAKKELARAVQCTEQLLEKYNELNLRHFEPDIMYLRARVELAAGNKEASHQTLSGALALCDAIGIHNKTWEMCWMLGKLEEEQGNISASVCLQERAYKEAMLIAEHAGSPELREMFLSRADVRLVLSVL